jgi:hypothetical protein
LQEKDASKNLKDALKNFESAKAEKTESEKTTNIEIREKIAEVKTLKSALRRRGISNEEREEKNTRLTLFQTFINEQKEGLKSLKENFKKIPEKTIECRKALEMLQAERGKPESSLIADVELLLYRHHIEREAYHRGDFNGVCCRRVVGNAAVLVNEVRTIMKVKKDENCEDSTVDEKLDELEMTSGLLDAAFAHLNVSYPTDPEKSKAREAVVALSNQWRMVGHNVTLNAHIMEKHVCGFNKKWGVGDKEESFIEQGHQVGIKDNCRYARLTNFEKKTASTLKTRAAATHPLVVACKDKVLRYSKRKLPNPKSDGAKKIKKAKVKEEKDIKCDYYVSNFKKEE